MLRNLPIPENYPSLFEWAKSLIAFLEEPVKNQPVQLATYTVANLPSPNQDGMLAFATDEIGGATLVYSHNGTWLRTSDRSEAIADVSVTIPLSTFTLTTHSVTVTTS